MRLRIIATAMLLAAVLASAEAQDPPKKAHEDGLFGLRVNVEGFDNPTTEKQIRLVSVAAPTRNGAAVVLSLHRETTLDGHIKFHGEAMKQLGLEETLRKNGRLGSLKGTFIEHSGKIGPREVKVLTQISEGKDDVWSLQSLTDSSDAEAVLKFFNDMARSFNTLSRISPRRAATPSVLACERFGFSIDTEGGLGTPMVNREVTVFTMDIKREETLKAVVMVSWAGRAPYGDIEVDDMEAPVRKFLGGKGYTVRKISKERFSGRDALRAEMTIFERETAMEAIAYYLPAGDELFGVIGAWDVEADEAIRKQVTEAVATVRLSNPGKNSSWPGKR